MKKAKRLLALLLALLLLASAGCTSSDTKDQKKDDDKGVSSTSQTPEPTPTPEEPEESLDPELVDNIKYNVYVEMNNKIVDVLDTLYSYYEVVEYADEFALLADSQYTYKYDISPYNTDLLEDAEYVATLEPAFEPLDELTLEIIDPMRTLMDTFSAIYRDYDYAADQYAKPKEYHKAIQANAAIFETLAYLYMDAIQEMSIERVEADEQRMLDEGQALAYGFSHSITVVKKLVNACYDQEVNDYNLLELDLAPIRPLYQELLDTIEAYKAAAEDNNQLMEESMTADGAYHIGTQIDRMVSAIDHMIDQVEGQYMVSDPGRTYLGSLLYVNEVLADCIELYNSTFAS